jgi:hypothetical protein
MYMLLLFIVVYKLTLPALVAQVTSSQDRTNSSAARKRIATDDPSDDDDESDAFEDVSMKDAADTPEASEASDDVNTGDEKEPTPPPKPTVRRNIGGAKGKQAASNSTKSPVKSAAKKGSPKSATKAPHKAEKKGPSEDAGFEDQPPPKRRELPFQRKADPLPPPSPTAPVTRSHDLKAVMGEDSDTEEEL